MLSWAADPSPQGSQRTLQLKTQKPSCLRGSSGGEPLSPGSCPDPTSKALEGLGLPPLTPHGPQGRLRRSSCPSSTLPPPGPLWLS